MNWSDELVDIQCPAGNNMRAGSMEERQMAIKFPSDEWVQEWERQLNASESYAQAAANWVGDNLIVVLPDENYSQTTYIYINLERGRAFGACLPKSLEERKALFTSTAPFGTWRKVLEGRMDVLQAMFSNKIKLVGSMAAIQRQPKATYELVKVAGSIDTDWGS
jgi:putative sterol carrier protein